MNPNQGQNDMITTRKRRSGPGSQLDSYRCDACRHTRDRCVACRAARAASVRKRRAARIAAGVCPMCGAPAVPTQQLCARHAEDNRRHSYMSHRRARAAARAEHD